MLSRVWQHASAGGVLFPVVYLDAIRVKVRVDHRVASRSAHIAVGVDMDGIKHVLGIWVQAEEGASLKGGSCALSWPTGESRTC